MANANVQKTGKKNEITLEELFFWKQWSENGVGTGEWIESTAYPLLRSTFIDFLSALIIKYSTHWNLIIVINLSLCY